MEIFRRKKWITDESFASIKNEGLQIAAMIKGLINSILKLKAQS
jgi:hypothetical protein